ncbi:hypothetical protein HHK36_011496 [Tetracentron sinense]|uniref:Uncharacterized protein n=1 Tax=Tetracentron sinense TaxID=13715 RepID=A0A834Z9F3_TETSI|nr:hypothetical protein HHK36_011496 [Tetracentron sinense]
MIESVMKVKMSKLMALKMVSCTKRFQGQRLDPKLGLDKQVNEDPGAQPHEQDMEIGYEDNTLPQTVEGLEHKFLDDIMKLTKEQSDAEDVENARHREKIREINAQYQEKLTVLRACHANKRENFLHRESQAQQHKYQQSRISHYSNSMGPSDTHRYGGAASRAAVNEAHQAYATDQFDSYRDVL